MTQNEQVLQYMKEHGRITSFDAFKMGILRLSARIWELRNKEGYRINGETVHYKTSGGKSKSYTVFSLEE